MILKEKFYFFRGRVEQKFRKRAKSDQSRQIYSSSDGRSLQSENPNYPQIFRKRHLFRIERKKVHAQRFYALPIKSGHDQRYSSDE